MAQHPMQVIPNLCGHPVVLAATELLYKLQRDQTADIDAYNEPAPESSTDAAERVFLTGCMPDLTVSCTTKAELHRRITIRARAIDRQKTVLRKAENQARRELIGGCDLQTLHRDLLQAVADAAGPFGEAVAKLDELYSALEASGLGGASLGHHNFPAAFHLGRLSDPNSRLAAWHEEVKAAGHKLKAK